MIDVALLGYQHVSKYYLVFVVDAPEGFAMTTAMVNLEDPNLELYENVDLVETGNSLMWLSENDLTHPAYNVVQPVG